MTNMPGMFVLRARESRERPRERHHWHLINTPARLFVQNQVPASGPRGGSCQQDASGYSNASGYVGTHCAMGDTSPQRQWGPALQTHTTSCS